MSATYFIAISHDGVYVSPQGFVTAIWTWKRLDDEGFGYSASSNIRMAMTFSSFDEADAAAKSAGIKCYAILSTPVSAPLTPTFVFAVFKYGVFRHECGGIFTTRAAAVSAARILIEGEKDDYHSYEVIAFPIDAITKRNPITARNGCVFVGGLQEPEALETFSRNNGQIV